MNATLQPIVCTVDKGVDYTAQAGQGNTPHSTRPSVGNDKAGTKSPADGIKYYKDATLLNIDTNLDVVLTRRVRRFWEAVVKVSEEYRVAAVGTPGVGKSTTVVYAVKKLLEAGVNVVYHKYDASVNDRYYMQFKPMAENDALVDVEASVFPGSKQLDNIDLLVNKETCINSVYIVDPGEGTHKVCCDPGTYVNPRVIIVASADERHWGGKAFVQRNGVGLGTFMYYPMPRKEQIFAARCHYLSGNEDMDRTTFESRHRYFGRVPRFLFGKESAQKLQRKKKEWDADALPYEYGVKLITGSGELGTVHRGAPKSTLVALHWQHCQAATTDHDKYATGTFTVVSDYVLDLLVAHCLGRSWAGFENEENRTARGLSFEAFARTSMSLQKKLLVSRVGKQSTNETIPIGTGNGLSSVEQTWNMVKDVKKNSAGKICYSQNQSEPLVDFMYKEGKNFMAIQTTIAGRHNCHVDTMKQFLDRLALPEDGGVTVTIIFAVPDSRFEQFATQPADPLARFKEQAATLMASTPVKSFNETLASAKTNLQKVLENEPEALLDEQLRKEMWEVARTMTDDTDVRTALTESSSSAKQLKEAKTRMGTDLVLGGLLAELESWERHICHIEKGRVKIIVARIDKPDGNICDRATDETSQDPGKTTGSDRKSNGTQSSGGTNITTDAIPLRSSGTLVRRTQRGLRDEDGQTATAAKGKSAESED